MIDELDGAPLVLANILLANWTVETAGFFVEIRTTCNNIYTSLMVGSEMMLEEFTIIKDLVAEMTGVELSYYPAKQRLTNPLRPLTRHVIRL